MHFFILKCIDKHTYNRYISEYLGRFVYYKYILVSAELFACLFPGLFSSLMREQANITHDGPKWIVLDGDIDPMWIESLNTVMDDNKVDKIK